MTDNLKKTIDLLNKNENLKKEVMANPPKTEQDIINIAAKLGVKISKEDLLSVSKNLDEKDLEQVLGGNRFKDECETGATVTCIVLAGTSNFIG